MRRVPQLLLLVGWATCACAEEPAPPEAGQASNEPVLTEQRPSAGESKDLLRLDSDLLPRRVPLLAAKAPALSVRYSWPEAATAAPLAWWSVSGPAGGPFRFDRVGADVTMPQDVQGVLATLGLIDVKVGEALRISLSFTLLGDSPLEQPALAGLLEMTTALDLSQQLEGTAARRLMEQIRDRSVILPVVERRGETLQLELWLRVAAPTRQLVLVLLRPDVPVRLDQLVVERHSLPDLLAAIPSPPHERGPVDSLGRVQARLDRVERRALRLSPDTLLSWDLPEHTRPYRFEAALGLAPRARELGGALQLSIDADDQRQFSLTSWGSGSTATDAWTALAVDLPVGTRRLSLRARWPAGDGPVAVLAHPRLRRATASPRHNLLIVSLDTLRADRLGCYGGPASSEHIDAFAAESLRFETAYAHSSYTLPSHASLMSGQLPALHGVRRTHDRVDSERTPLLAMSLAQAGYVTAAFAGGGFLSASYGFGAGFDRFSHNDPCWPVDTKHGRLLLRKGSEAGNYRYELLRRSNVDLIVDWFADQPPGAPFFALVHTYATHDYAPDRRGLERAGLLTDEGQELRLDRREFLAWEAGADELLDAVSRQFTLFYDATIGTADEFVGTLLQGLERAGLADNTIVVLLSDHGEELGELGAFGHGQSLHEGVTRIPLLVRIPGRPARVHSEPIGLTDLAPWLLELLDVPVDARMRPPQALAPEQTDPPGRSVTLLEVARGEQNLFGVRSGRFKLLQGDDVETTTLHDLSTAEGEARDVSALHPEIRAQLERYLQGYRVLLDARPTGEAQELDPETRRMLEQLGYLQADG
jgi:arylsulfatase A-like enzyme